MNGWRMSGLGKFNVSLFYGFNYQSTVNGRTLCWCTPPNAEPERERGGHLHGSRRRAFDTICWKLFQYLCSWNGPQDINLALLFGTQVNG